MSFTLSVRRLSRSYALASVVAALPLGFASSARAQSRPDVVVRPAELHQTIRGFGASAAWVGPLTDDELDLLFSSETGAGLNLLRLRIPPDGSTDDGAAATAQRAQTRGVTI